jgi:hypothetical protein
MNQAELVINPVLPAREPGEGLPPEEPADIVIMQDPATPEEKRKFFSIVLLIGSTFLLLALVAALGHAIEIIYTQTETSLAPIFLSVVLFNFASILQNGVFYFKIDKHRVMGSYYLTSSLTLFTKLLVYLGFYLYSTGILSEETVKYFVYPDIAIRLVLYCQQNSGTQMLSLLNCFSLYIIAGFLEDNSLYYLSMAFLIYYFLCVFLASLTILMWMLFGFLFKIYMTSPELLNTFFPDLLDQFQKKLAIYFLMCCLFTYHVFAYFMFIWGMHQFIAQGYMRKMQVTTDGLPQSLAIAGRAFVILGYLDIVLCLVLLLLFKNDLKVLFEKFKGKEITFQSFKENVQLNLQRQGENYFKRKSRTLEPLIEMQDTPTSLKKEASIVGTMQEFGECQICMASPASTWFEPCGHTIVCQQCLNDFLKKYDKCMLCRGKISKVHLVYWDPETQTFKSKGAYNLKL